MKSVRRPVVALLTSLVLTLIQAAADPTGLLALVGWSGARPSFSVGAWQLAPYLAFIPVMLVLTWWATLRAGDRFWTLTVGIILAVLLAQAATALVMTWNPAAAAWAAGFVVAKAVPAALIISGITRWLGGPTIRLTLSPGSAWPPAVLFAAAAPLMAGLWWTGAAYAPGIPTARPANGIASVLITMVLIVAATMVSLQWMRQRVPGVLGGWLAAMIAGGSVGLAQAVVGFFFDNGVSGDLWPLMAAYITVADGLAFGACVGWIVGIGAVLTDQLTTGSGKRTPRLLVASTALFSLLTASLVSGAGAGVAPAVADEAPAPAAFLRTKNGFIADGNGNQVLLRGVNVNQLVDFYQPRPEIPPTRPLTKNDFAGMAKKGFNMVRLNISWSALEPERGTLDPGYLARISDAVRWAKEYGIYTVLDMHQDGWWKGATSEGTTCRPGTEPMLGYDGAPAWATITDDAPRCQFTGRDISAAGNRAFQNFYFNTDGVRTALAQTWGKLAAEYRNEPMVAGFDLLNEPGFGETAPVTTSHLLGQFYDEAITEIRNSGARQIVFFEPSIFWSGLGFDTGPAADFTKDKNIVFSPHLYAESITMDRDLGIPPIVSLERQFRLAQRVAAAYDAPLWSGEYGYWGEEKDTLSRLTRYAKAEDENLLGSAYWVWKQACSNPQNGIGPVGDALMMQDCVTGGDLPPKSGPLEILSRAYPQSAPGRLISLEAEGPALTLTGIADVHGCGLRIWIPGKAKPNVMAAGLTSLKRVQVPGGWTVTGCADGEYTLSSGS
ncbi:glycoside hydrolase family 5 protein [Paeniglutamicibacter cryotolerans]|uniref:Glycoside hydrolase family 5 domain-containing protein n=1 Tax=Paeniglutamicibacter cryotolerans TaxID=670079 RepID=A0A839QQ81_9MICC|nr:cellulase family glycosylhydrolase [Paeniglutamicibacter cryotolerans]MBB2996914.1 hypothetical protein [Paeniglutamicibacter cryotolerans]